MDQEAVARLIAQHDILAVPVVDAEGRVKGIVTVDDVVDVVVTEATEDIQKIGGTVALDAPYLQTSIVQMLKRRAGWLVVLLVGGMFTTTALSIYQQEFEKAAVLVMFLPLILSSGGNSGSQATTLVVRAMALGQVRLRDWWLIVRRELASGLCLGALLGVVGLLRILVEYALLGKIGGKEVPEHFFFALSVAASLIGVVTLGTLTGALLPLLLRALRFDPASASAPLVATLLDVSGVVMYFSVAQALLTGRIL
jgi:magnesium transporter